MGGGLVVLGIVVLVLCAALVAWPRATTGILTSDLHYRLDMASASTRDLQSSIDVGIGHVSPYGAAAEPPLNAVWQAMPSTLSRIRTEMPASVRAITAPGRYVGRAGGVGGRGVPASGPPNPPVRSSYVLTVEADPLLKSDAILVAGKWPAAGKPVAGPSPIPVVTAAAAAKFLHWSIGQTQTLSVAAGTPEVVKLVGTIKPRDANSDYWQLDRTRAEAGSVSSPDGDSTVYNGVIWMNASSWVTTGSRLAGQTIASWYSVRGSALSVDDVSQTIGDLQRFLSVPRRVGPASLRTQARFSTNLPSVTDDFLARASPAAAVLSVVGTGPLGTGCAVVLLGVLLLVDRRRLVLSLIRSRGASERRLCTIVAVEVAVSAIPAALAGGLLALCLTPGPLDPLAITTVAACALLPVGAAAVRSGVARPQLARRSPRRSSVRWVAEVVVLLLAGLSIVLLVERGLTPDSTAVGVDPLLTLAPILIVAVACLAILRGYPLVLRWTGSLLRRRRGVIGYVGWASVARTPARLLSIFAVVAGVSITIFSVTILSTERAGISDAELQRVGADISITAQPLATDAPARLRKTPGVARVVAIDSAGGLSITGVSEYVALFTVDASQLADVQAALPSALRQFRQLGFRTGGRTTAIAGGFQEKPPGASAIKDTAAIPVRLTKLKGTLPTFVSDPPWILLDRAAIPHGSTLPEIPLAVLLQIRPGADTPATLAAIRRIVGSSATVVDTAQLVRASKSAPVVSGFEQLTAAALGFSAFMGAIALILTLLLNTGARTRLLARLRALGFARRQSSGLIAWELGPLTVLGVVAGLIVGLILPPLLLGSVDLAGFTGSVSNPAIILDPLAILATIGGFVLAAALSTLVAIAGTRRGHIAAILRNSGED